MVNKEIKVNTKREDSNTYDWTGSYPIPESLNEALEKYGEALVFDTFASQLVTNVQNIARAALRAEQDVAAAVASYVPGQKRERAPADPTQQVLAGFAKLDPEARAALVAQLRAQLKG